MRLIDADALKKALKDAHINMKLTFDIATFNCVMNTIDNAPTVEERQPRFWHPIQNGEWTIVLDTYCECPFCKNREVKFSKYCPECGARLKGGAE